MSAKFKPPARRKCRTPPQQKRDLNLLDLGEPEPEPSPPPVQPCDFNERTPAAELAWLRQAVRDVCDWLSARGIMNHDLVDGTSALRGAIAGRPLPERIANDVRQRSAYVAVRYTYGAKS